MTNEDYIRLYDLLWQRIMHIGLQKIDFDPIQEEFSDLGETTGYNIIQLIIDRLAKGDEPNSAMNFVRNSLFQAGAYVEESDLMEIVNMINEKNQNEIMAAQTLQEMIENRESWETTCMAVEIVLLPDEY
jgi:hypothetical protein